MLAFYSRVSLVNEAVLDLLVPKVLLVNLAEPVRLVCLAQG